MTGRRAATAGPATLALLWVLAVPLAAQGHYRRAPSVYLPDSSVTPGELRPGATKEQVCTVSTDSFRVAIPAATRDSVLKLYPPDPAVPVQWDHYIPLALGGAPTSPRNLWRQPYGPGAGAAEKDRLEVWLWRQVCAGRVSLEAAQSAFRGGNWYGAYLAWRADSLPRIGPGGPVRP